MTRVAAELREQQRQTAAELLGQLYAQAAVQKMSGDIGDGFVVSWQDVENVLSMDTNNKERLAGQGSLLLTLFGGVSHKMLEESESLQKIATSYGYSISVWKTIARPYSFHVDFAVASGED